MVMLMAQIDIETLKATVMAILARSGYPPDEAQIVQEVLLYAQLRGNNQGVVKLIGAGLPRDPAVEPIRIVRETKLSALVDGGRTIGMVVMQYATDLAIARAREHGFGIVGTRQTYTSTGAIGYYVNRAALAGTIAFAFSGSGEYVAMHGAYEPLFGTNPLAIGIPNDGAPLVFDMATAAIARYGVIEAQTANRVLPSDVAYDAVGAPTTDPAAALAGAIRTFGGYKGAALSLMVEILTGALVETTLDDQGRKTDAGNLLLVIDPALLTDNETFTDRVSALVARVKASHKLPGVEEILVPGERGNRIWEAARATGQIEIEDKLWAALQAAAS